MILLHGHPFNRSMWAPQATVLAAEGYRVIAPDLRGYGESPALEEKTPLARFADDLAALLAGLGIEHAVVGGVSMGGQIALEVRLRHPGLVRALVLSDTSPAPETPEGVKFRRELAERLLEEGMAPYADEVMDKMLAPYNLIAQPGAAARVSAMMRATDPRGRPRPCADGPSGPTTGPCSRRSPRPCPAWCWSAPTTCTPRSRTPRACAPSPRTPGSP